MLFQEPQPTDYDLSFSIFGIPVRVHPMFWLIGLLLGASSGTIEGILIWVGALFVSILVHELGHALVMRFYGEVPRIALYWGGGLAISGGLSQGASWGRMKTHRGTWEQVIISFAGPLAGFLLAGVVIGVSVVSGMIAAERELNLSDKAITILSSIQVSLLWINIFWGLVNLMPVHPLDGGQISRALFMEYQPRDGLRNSLWLSVLFGALVAAAGVFFLQSIFMAFLFGSLAFSSYQTIQQMDRGGFGGGPW